jgi:hypothetical protein
MGSQTARISPPPAVSTQQRDLLANHPHEAAEHRRILFERGSGLASVWRNFQVFLNDLGAAPSKEHVVTRLAPGDLTYGPGKVAWMHRDRQPVLVDLLSTVKPVSEDNHSQWVKVRETQMEYSALAKLLGVPFEAMAMALRNNISPEVLVQNASIREALIKVETPWLNDERREAFMLGYRMWHMQIQQDYVASATPAFLYVYSALPAMVKLRRNLEELDLWDPPTLVGKAQRRDHDLWRRYCEAMMRVESARMDCPRVPQYSLSTDVAPMWESVQRLEQRFRGSAAPLR